MRFWKRWSFLTAMLLTGILYFHYVDHWQVYARTIRQAKQLYGEYFGEPGGGSGTKRPEGTDSPGMGNPGEGDGTHRPEGGNPGIQGQPEGTASGNGSLPEGTASGNGGWPGGTASGNGGWPGGTTSGNGGWPGGTASGNGGWPGGTASGNGSWPGGTASGNGSWPGGTASGNSGQPVREFVTVEDDYFADAVFIGDSRTVGMYEYGGLEEISTFYASKGLTVYKIFDSEIVKVAGQKQKITVEEALQQNTFARIYLMIGINEMGTGTVETFIAKYKEVVAHLQELQPEADLFIQGIMKVTTERSNQGDYINNEGIEARNAELEKLADGRKIFYLDVNPLICDETGGMEPSYTFDGVHLKAQYIDIWKNFLKEHAILQE